MNRKMKKQYKTVGVLLMACLLAGCGKTEADVQTEGKIETSMTTETKESAKPQKTEVHTETTTQEQISKETETSSEEKKETSQELVPGTIVRRPAAGSRANSNTGDVFLKDLYGNIDLKSVDLSGFSLPQGDELLQADFNTLTKWPDSMPEGIDINKLLEIGKDPGLGIRRLHEQGITGKGIGIAILDQTLLVDHEEYSDRIRLYQEYHEAATKDAQKSGSAVASIAVGKTTGVAPEALLYYIADDNSFDLGNGETDIDVSKYAEDIERLIALNEMLGEEEKIRVIAIAQEYIPYTKGAEEMDTAIAKARKEGIEVFWESADDPIMSCYIGAGWEAYQDPNEVDSILLAQTWGDRIKSGTFSNSSEDILIPIDRRTLASETGISDYVYYRRGESSFTVPYVAGLFALACQINKEVTLEQFTKAARETGHPVTFLENGTEYAFRVINPEALLEKIKE